MIMITNYKGLVIYAVYVAPISKHTSTSEMTLVGNMLYQPISIIDPGWKKTILFNLQLLLLIVIIHPSFLLKFYIFPLKCAFNQITDQFTLGEPAAFGGPEEQCKDTK